MKKKSDEQETRKEWNDIELKAIYLKNALKGLFYYTAHCTSEDEGLEGAHSLLAIIEEYAKSFCNDIINKNFTL